MKFRKKPVVIEAFQLTEETRWDNKPRLYVGAVSPFCIGDPEEPTLRIVTLEGNHRCQIGDWIIRGVKGELYPCKPDIFKATYEPVEEEP